MKRMTLTICILLALGCYGQKDTTNEKRLNFLASLNNASTIGYFTVVTIKNLNTGKVKEICTKGIFVSGALHIELGANYDGAGMRKVFNYINGKDRFFELRNKEALSNVGFDTYSEKLLDTIRKKYNFRAVEQKILKERQFRIRLEDREMEAFAHILFNMGYMTGENSCWGGELFYVDRNDPKWRH